MSDRERLMKAEARELVRHKAAGGSTDYIARRAGVVDRLYGVGARDAIREMMKNIRYGDEA